MFSTLIVLMILQNVCLCPNSSGYLYIYIKCVHFFNIPFTSKKQKKKQKLILRLLEMVLRAYRKCIIIYSEEPTTTQ